MKKRSDNPHILLIRSPFSIPGHGSGRWASIKSALAAMTPHLQTSDAADDFFQKMLVEGDLFPSGADAPRWGQPRVGSTDRSEPAEMIGELELLNQALEAASKACHPCRFHRNGFAHEGLKGVDELLDFADDAEANPFWRYAYERWQPCSDSPSVDLALIYLYRPGQMAAAATLARAWQKRWPRIPLKWIDPDMVAGQSGQRLGTGSSGQWPYEWVSDMADLKRDISNSQLGDSGRMTAISKPSVGVEAQPLKAGQMPDIIQAALKVAQAPAMIVWRDCGDATGAVTAQLYAASRQGLWNHVILDGDSARDLETFAAANSNIVHSYCHEDSSASMFSDPEFSFPSGAPAYGHTHPLPGKPLWMKVQDPRIIARLLARYGSKTLMRLRVRDGDQSLFEVGQELSYRFNPPAKLPEGYLEEIVRMVDAGGSVNTQFVRHNLERAFLIAYVEEEGVIVGNSSLKQPRREYIDAVSAQSGIDLHHYLERGYTSVRPEYRGLGVGVALLDGLTKRAGDHKIFSVIAESNIATQKMAIRNRTRRVATFFSQRAQKEMSVWIPEWMLPEDIDLPEQPAL